jgi:transcription termination factor Rho
MENKTAVHPWHTADGLIEAFGDQAYHSAIRLMVIMISQTPDDEESLVKIRAGIQELMQRRYHDKPNTSISVMEMATERTKKFVAGFEGFEFE